MGRVLIVIPGLSDMNAELDVSGGTVERLCLTDLRSQAFTKQNGLLVNAFVRWPSAKWPRQLKFKLRYSNGTGVSGWLPLRFLDDELSWRSYGAVFWTIDLEKVPARTPPTRFSLVQGSDVKKRAAASGTVVVDRLMGGADTRALIGTRGKLR